MRADIHPKYEKLVATCSCGNVIETRSALGKETIYLDVCSACHPFYTGKQKECRHWWSYRQIQTTFCWYVSLYQALILQNETKTGLCPFCFNIQDHYWSCTSVKRSSFSENNHLVESALLHSMHWQTGSYHSSELIKFQSVLQSNSSIFFL